MQQAVAATVAPSEIPKTISGVLGVTEEKFGSLTSLGGGIEDRAAGGLQESSEGQWETQRTCKVRGSGTGWSSE